MKRIMAVMLSMALAGSVIAAQAQQDRPLHRRRRRARKKSGRQKRADCFRAAQ